MKKTLLFLGLASVMSVFSGCTKDELEGSGSDNSPKAPQTLIAQVGESATRTTLSPDGKSVVWSAKDAIAVYSSSNAGKYVKYTLSSGANSSVGEFTTVNTTDVISGLPYGLYEGPGAKNPYLAYVAVSPADVFWFSPNGPVNMELGANIPEFQEATAGSYDKAAFPMVAVLPTDPSPAISPLSMHFRYIASLIRMPLKGAVTLLQIEIAEMNEDVMITGPVFFEYRPDPYFFSSIADRDAFFFDYSKPLDYTKYTVKGNGQSSVRLTGTMALSSTATDYYAVVHANEYTGFRVYFTLEDGSKIEKQIVPTKENNVVKMGDVMALPEFDVAAPFFSTVTINGETVTWTKNVAATSYSLVVGVGEATLFTIDNITADLNFTTNIVPRLEPFVGGAIPLGEEVPISLSVKAVYANKAVAEATYSVPVEKMFTAPIPELIVDLPAPNKFGNYLFYARNGEIYDKVEYAVIDKKTSNPQDFADALFKPFDFDFAAYVTVGTDVDYGDHSVMAKATIGGNVVSTKIKSWTVVNPGEPELPSAKFSITMAIGTWMEDKFFELTFIPEIDKSDYMTTFDASATGMLYWVENSDVTDPATVDFSGAQSHSLNMDYEFPMDISQSGITPDPTKSFAFKLVITGVFGKGVTSQTGYGRYTQP